MYYNQIFESNMQYEKRKNSSKKLKNNKSQQKLEPPLTTIMQELTYLKKQIKNINSKKQNSITVIEPTKNIQNDKQIDQYKSLPVALYQINYTSREKKLKMDIQLNKLRKCINKGQIDLITMQTNLVLNLVNIFHQEDQRQLQILQRQLQQVTNQFNDFRNRNDYQVYKQKYKNTAKINKQLEQEVLELRRKITLTYDLNNGKEQCFQKFTQDYALISKQNEQLIINNSALRQQIAELKQAAQASLATIKNLKTDIQRKQSQANIIKENINFLTLQCEKFKNQRKQFELLYDEYYEKYKNTKGNLQNQIQLLEKDQNKLKKSLNEKTTTTQQLDQLTKAKVQLGRQVLQLKDDKKQLQKQIFQIKESGRTKDHRIRQLEIYVQQMLGSVQKLEKNLQSSQLQNNNLYLQIEQLQKANDNYKNQYLKMKSKQNQIRVQGSRQKNKVISQIQDLIGQHKNQDV